MALLNVPAVTTRTYRRSVAFPAVASRCQAGAAVTAVKVRPVTAVNVELSAESCTATVTDVPAKEVSWR